MAESRGDAGTERAPGVSDSHAKLILPDILCVIQLLGCERVESAPIPATTGLANAAKERRVLLEVLGLSLVLGSQPLSVDESRATRKL